MWMSCVCATAKKAAIEKATEGDEQLNWLSMHHWEAECPLCLFISLSSKLLYCFVLNYYNASFSLEEKKQTGTTADIYHNCLRLILFTSPLPFEQNLVHTAYDHTEKVLQKVGEHS